MKKFCLIVVIFLVGIAPRQQFPDTSLYSVPLSFTDDTGQTLAMSQFSGKDVVVVMAYTTCKTACPLTMNRLQKIQRELSVRKKSNVEFLIITFNPSVDTPAVLHAYRVTHHILEPHWHFLTGSEGDTRRLSLLLGMSYQKDDKTGEIMHSNAIHLLNKNGVLIETLNGLNAEIGPLVEKVEG